MSQIWERIAAGQGGYVTVIGIGGVFLALICMYLFIAISHRTIHQMRSRRRKHRPGGISPKDPGTPEAPAPKEAERAMPETKEAEAEMVAAIAVACALQEVKNPRPRNQRGLSTTPGSWRMAGRLELMKPLGR